MFKMRKTLKMVVFSLRAARKLHLTVEKKKPKRLAPGFKNKIHFVVFIASYISVKWCSPH